MFCTHCGAENTAGARFCIKCGVPLDAAAAPAVSALPSTQGFQTAVAAGPAYVPVAQTSPYGGFWIRVLAFFIDTLVISPLFIALGLIFGLSMAGLWPRNGEDPSPAAIAALMGPLLLMAALFVVAGWLYHVWMESSSMQATFGKKVLGMRVTDLQGNRISFGRANVRYFGKILSGMVFYIGYLMVGFTDRKQGLHDMIASTLVLKR